MHTTRQHLIRIVSYLYRAVRYTIIPYTLLLFNEIQAGTGEQPYWLYGVAAAIGTIVFLWSVVAWWRDFYRIENQAIYLQNGVFTIIRRTIPIERIASLSMEQTWMDKLCGAVTIKLQTSDSFEEADVVLVLTNRNLQALLTALHSVKVLDLKIRTKNIQRTGVVQNKLLWAASPKDILMRSLSSNTFWMGVPLCVTLLSYIVKWIKPQEPEEQVSVTTFIQNKMWEELLELNMLHVLFVVVGIFASSAFVCWLLSLVMMQIRYYNWIVVRKGHHIEIKYGGMERMVFSLQVSNIQSIRIKEHVLHRVFGYASVWIDSVGYAGERRAKILIPAIRRDRLLTVMHSLLPEFELISPERNLPIGKAAYFIGLPVLTVSLLLLISAFISSWVLLISPLLLCIYAYGSGRYNLTKWDVHNQQCVISKPGITLTTVYVKRRAVQSISHRQTRIQRKFGIYRIKLVIDSPSKWKEYVLTGPNFEDVHHLLKWFKNNKDNDQAKLY
ncbi:PH domain-containing protein [Paenibacillus assamensis]|uniref:PH domain-containing protein n=1 Tax=Paenibacillus assamensis TaxID=311244 RepID=UPI0003FB7661|nr:PH domain-containing protein [Paenibacillus assamensis]